MKALTRCEWTGRNKPPLKYIKNFSDRFVAPCFGSLNNGPPKLKTFFLQITLFSCSKNGFSYLFLIRQIVAPLLFLHQAPLFVRLSLITWCNNAKTFFWFIFSFFYFISTFILLTRRKATEALIHEVSNYSDVLAVMPRCCYLLETFYLVF